MLSSEQARLACDAKHQEAQAEARRQRLVKAARLQRRAVRQEERALRATRRAATAAAVARRAWTQLT